MVTILGADGIGYGIRRAEMGNALDYDIDVIAMDGGSTDYGANYLSDGNFIADEDLSRNDLAHMLELRDELDVPLMIANVGGGGTNAHVDKTAKLIREAAADSGLEFSLASIYTDVEKDILLEKIDEGVVSQLNYEIELEPRAVVAADEIVSFIGPEPYMQALMRGADVVIGGRSLDVSPYSALPLIKMEESKASAVTLAKLMECGTYVCKQPADSTGYLIGQVYDDHAELIAPAADLEITKSSAISMLLYEKADPNVIHLPDGIIDVSNINITEIDDGAIRVDNTEFVPHEESSILVEGNELAGYRSISVSGINDPVTLSQIDSILADVRATTEDNMEHPPDKFDLTFRKYGMDAVSLYDHQNGSEDEPVREIGLIIDAIGDTQEIANSVCSMARTTLFHEGFDGRLSISGNLAHGIQPIDIPAGPIYQWSIQHLIKGVDSEGMSSIEMEEVA